MAKGRGPDSAHPTESGDISSGPQAEDPVGRASPSRITIAQLFAEVREREGKGFFGAQEAVLAIFERLVLAVDQHKPPQVPLLDKTSISIGGSPVAQVLDNFTSTISSETSEETSEPATTTTETVDLSGSVGAAADEIDRLCPNPTSEPEEVDGFLTAVWWTLFSAVRAVPYNHGAQDQLAAVVENLRSRARATVRVWGAQKRLWRDLPLFSSYLGEDWYDPADAYGPDVDAALTTRWVNLNAFIARLMNKGVFVCPEFAIMSIRDGLEKEHPPTGGTREYTLRIASQWILLCGTPLFKDAFRGDNFGEIELRATAPEQLYSDDGGKPGLCMHRWRFWMKRLEELGSGDAEEGVRHEARHAAQLMQELIEQDCRAIARRLGSDEKARDNQVALAPQLEGKQDEQDEQDKQDEQDEQNERDKQGEQDEQDEQDKPKEKDDQDEFYDALTELDLDVLLGPPDGHRGWWFDPNNVVPFIVGSTFANTVAAIVRSSLS